MSDGVIEAVPGDDLVVDLAGLLDFDGADDVIASWCAGIAPDPRETVWEWADRDENVKLPAISAAEAGAYDSSRTPYLREILTNLSAMSPVISTILMKGSQIGASQAGLVFILNCIAVGGGPLLVVAPTIAMAELYSKQRLDPIIAECAPARAKIPPNRGKNSGNTLRLKTFPGGMVRLTGANSANALKSMPAKYAIYEEPDEFVPDLQGQGNAVEMVRRRLTTYGRRAKEFANCTPTLSSRSIIHPLYLTGDQRLYRMPCPHGCGHRTVFTKELFRFEKGKPATAHFVCENSDCGKPIIEARHKTRMMAEGVWVPQVEDAPPDMPRSYYLPSFYSPVGWESWEAIAKKVEMAEGNYELSKAVWNQIYGLPWSDVTETPDAETIWGRRATYVQRQTPPGVYFLCAGVDVGIDHIEIGVWGYGRKGRRWLIEHVRLEGRYTDPELWARAKAFLHRRYLHPSGAVLPIRKIGVDRGKWPDVVMPWVMRQDPVWIVATRGSEKVDAAPLKKSRWKLEAADGTWRSEEGVDYWTLGVGHYKLELMGQLNLGRPAPDDEPPPGYVHLPADIGLPYVEQLVSEEYIEIKTKKRGRPSMAWRPIGGARHEALDTCNIARAMADLLGWSTWSDVEYAREDRALARAAEEMRVLMANLAREREAAGDTRPVTPESVMSAIVRPTIEGGAEDPVPAGHDARVLRPKPLPRAAVKASPEDPAAAPARPPAEVSDRNDPLAGLASSWGGWGEEAAPAGGAGIVGCTSGDDPLPVPALTRTAWDWDGDL